MRKFLIITSLCLTITGLEARVYRTFPDAVHAVFPQADNVKRRSVYLTREQMQRAQQMAQENIDTGLLVVYQITHAGKLLGWAYLDTHRVRTLNETLLVCIDDKERIIHVEQLSFAEPQEYMASDRFLSMFHGKILGPELSLKGKIPTTTGSTLTCSAVTGAVRRVLALHKIVLELNR